MTDEYASLRTKLRAISRIGNLSSLQMLLSTEEYTDYLIKSKVIECQAKQTEDLIQKIEAEITEINRQRKKPRLTKPLLKNSVRKSPY